MRCASARAIWQCCACSARRRGAWRCSKHFLIKPIVALIVGGGFGALASAQLAPPIEQRTPPAAAAAGQGAGFHDPRSAVKPLEERDGVVSWKLLASVETKMEKNRVAPVFAGPVKAMNDKTVRVQGFMMLLEPGDRQKHFLLSAVPTTCGFCVPPGRRG